jgi:hypothetical protein
VRKRRYPVGKPKYDGPYDGQHRTWTELSLDPDELMLLLGMPKGARLISIGSNAMTGVTITVEEEPLEV